MATGHASLNMHHLAVIKQMKLIDQLSACFRLSSRSEAHLLHDPHVPDFELIVQFA